MVRVPWSHRGSLNVTDFRPQFFVITESTDVRVYPTGANEKILLLYNAEFISLIHCSQGGGYHMTNTTWPPIINPVFWKLEIYLLVRCIPHGFSIDFVLEFGVAAAF